MKPETQKHRPEEDAGARSQREKARSRLRAASLIEKKGENVLKGEIQSGLWSLRKGWGEWIVGGRAGHWTSETAVTTGNR